MAQAPPVVLTIAGFDPSSGAGVTADIKTIAAHGCYGVACITALTVQSTAGVRRVEAVSAELVAETLRGLSTDGDITFGRRVDRPEWCSDYGRETAAPGDGGHA